MNSKTYWDKKIIEWENSMHHQGQVPAIEKLAAQFRKPLAVRSEISLQTLIPHLKNKKVLELGCGSGFFALEMYKQGHPRHISGLDMSGNAILRAKQLVTENGLEEKIHFFEADAADAELPEVDIVVGLGFLDYLNPQEITSLFNRLKTKNFLFTFSETQFVPLRFIHMIYLLSQKCPKHFYYSKTQISNFIGEKFGKVQFINDARLSFCCIFHNFNSYSKADAIQRAES